MTTMTLEVPDDLATQLQRDPALLPALLREVVNAKSAQVASLAIREAALTPDERVELETYRQLNHLVIRLQARAFCGQPLLNPRPQSADHATPPHS